MAFGVIKNVRKVFAVDELGSTALEPVVALDDASFQFEQGDLVALLGPSGCGKTTLLRIVGGLITKSAGSVAIGGSFLFSQAVPAMKQGFTPDVISTDLHSGSMNGGMKDILNTMSKFLNLGMPLVDVVKANTVRAAAVIKRPELGHLTAGAEADIAVLALRRGEFGFIDSGGNRMLGDQKLECELTIRAGQVVWDLNGRSRPMWTEAK